MKIMKFGNKGLTVGTQTNRTIVGIVSFGATKNCETREGNVYVRVTSERRVIHFN
jgi:hypothetical protein